MLQKEKEKRSGKTGPWETEMARGWQGHLHVHASQDPEVWGRWVPIPGHQVTQHPACKPERPPEGLALQRGRTAILGVPEVAVPQARRWAPKRWRCSAWQCGRGAGDSEVAGTTQRCSQGTGGRDHGADPAAHNKPLEGRGPPVHIRAAGTSTRDSPVQRRGRVGGLEGATGARTPSDGSAKC